MNLPIPDIKSTSDFLRLILDTSDPEKVVSDGPVPEEKNIFSVLLVNTDSGMLEYISTCLRREISNIHFIQATNTRHASTILKSIRPSLIIADLSMLIMNKGKLISEIVQNCKKSEVPVLVVSSADVKTMDFNRLDEMPNWSVLPNPFNQQIIIRCIHALLNNQS